MSLLSFHFKLRHPFVLTILSVLIWICAVAMGYAADAEKIARRGGCPDLIELIKELTPSVVSITIERHLLQKSSTDPPPLFRSQPGWLDERTKGRERSPLDSLGSGFFCDTEGHIGTNAHVVEGAAKILVTLSSGKVCSARAEAVHPKVDLALLRIDPPYALKNAPLGDSSRIEVGEWVLAVGNPYGLGRTVTVGIISGKGRFIGLGPAGEFIQTDASIPPGNSGGPLFNMAGEVIGVNTAIIAPGKGIGFSIPANYIRELVQADGQMRQPARGWLGIYVEDVSEDQARQLGMATPKGTFVDEVLGSTPAFSAGLKKGDLIIDTDGEPIRNGRQLSRIVAGTKPGDLIRMTILRDKKTRTVDIVVGKSPE